MKDYFIPVELQADYDAVKAASAKNLAEMQQDIERYEVLSVSVQEKLVGLGLSEDEASFLTGVKL